MSTRTRNVARMVTAPSFVFCGASPVITPLFAAAGLSTVSFVIHQALWLFAPLNLALLVRGFRRHRRITGWRWERWALCRSACTSWDTPWIATSWC